MRRVTVLLSIPVVALLTQPLWAPTWGAGILGEVAALGPAGAAAAIIVFFGLVALYCQSLARLQAYVVPEARVRSPRSVWLMFAIPLNFVEDFFIVADLGASLRRDGRTAAHLTRVWIMVGFSWCALQVASLLPGLIGIASGVLALAAWASHWVMTARIQRLIQPSAA